MQCCFSAGRVRDNTENNTSIPPSFAKNVALQDNPRAVAEYLIAELRGGERSLQEILSEWREFTSRDPDSLGQLVQELRESSRAGRLSEHDLETLCRMLDGSIPLDGDPDATDELDPRPLPGGHPALPRFASQPPQLHERSLLRDRYVIGGRVGQGGMSVVYKATDLRRDIESGDATEIAVKVLRPELRVSASAIERLKREFRQTRALQHAGVVRMFDLDCDGDVWFITMELLEGTTLEARLKAPLPLETDAALGIASACADVLAYAHQRGIPHGDFKPGNVFLQDNGAVKVLDFGAAPAVWPSTPGDGAEDGRFISRVATRSYASPEMLDGQVAEPRDDVFSFACVVYELLCGRHPFHRVPASAARDAALSVKPLEQLTARQNAALARGLAWTRDGRPARIDELMQKVLDLTVTVEIEALQLPDEPKPEPVPAPPVASNWKSAIIAGVVAVVLAIGSVQYLSEYDESERATAPVAAIADAAPAVVSSPPQEAAIAPSSSPVANQISLTDSAAVPMPAAPGPPPTRTTAPAPTRPLRAKVSVDSGSLVVQESAHAAVVLLRREGDLTSSTQITWRVTDGSAHLGLDFGGGASGTVRFLPGQATRALYVPMVDDPHAEGDESFTLQLSARTADLASNSVPVTIVDDDQ